MARDREQARRRFSDDERFAVACALRDWIHGQSFSQCGPGVDTCPDWPLAFEIRDVALARLAALPDPEVERLRKIEAAAREFQRRVPVPIGDGRGTRADLREAADALRAALSENETQ